MNLAAKIHHTDATVTIDDGDAITVTAGGEGTLALKTTAVAPLTRRETRAKLAVSGDEYAATVTLDTDDLRVLRRELDAILEGGDDR